MSKFVEVPKSTTMHGAPYRSFAATALTIRSGPTSRGSSYRIGMPVLTPGPTARSGACAQRSATRSHSRWSAGTVVERQIPSTSSSSNSEPSTTASSSPVRPGSVARRKLSTSRSPSNRPSTVCVLPTSTARSTVVLGRVVVRLEPLAQPLRECLCGQLRIVVLAAQLLDGDVARRVDLGPRDDARGPVLVPHPDVLHLDVEERVARLRRRLQVELVAQIGRVRGEDAVAEDGEDGRVLALQRERQLRLELVEIVEMAHAISLAPR